MQAAAAVRRGVAAWEASQFHSSAAVLSKSTPHIRFAVREKRRDAKSALKNILLNGSPYQESSKKQMRKQKGSGTPNVQRSYPGKNPYGKNKQISQGASAGESLPEWNQSNIWKELKFGHSGGGRSARDSRYWDRDDRRRDEDYTEARPPSSHVRE